MFRCGGDLGSLLFKMQKNKRLKKVSRSVYGKWGSLTRERRALKSAAAVLEPYCRAVLGYCVMDKPIWEGSKCQFCAMPLSGKKFSQLHV